MYQIRRRRSATLIHRAVKQFSVINPHGGDGLGYSTEHYHLAQPKGGGGAQDELSGTCCQCIMEDARRKGAGFTVGS